MVEDEFVPEFSGYNTREARKQGQSVGNATKAIYTPLIDMVPSEPDTMMTAIVESQRLTNSTGQIYTIFTNDQQLYRVAVNVTWVYPELFPHFIPRLGGMHFLMSFIGSVGTLMSNSGLEEILQAAFGGVSKLLSGKKFPQNFRALHMLMEELLRETLMSVNNKADLMAILEDKAADSQTARLWVDILIKPVML